jgi:DNA repair exonuclease SbcCD ATPase subunit
MYLAPRMSLIEDLNIKQNESTSSIALIKTTIEDFEKQIKQVQTEKNAFILNNGICPCCGQKVEQSHISAITTFMEVQ